jgi:cell division protease FtsH
MAQALLEYETLTGEEIQKVLRGERLERPEDLPVPAMPPSPSLPVIDDEEDDPRPARGWGPEPRPA